MEATQRTWFNPGEVYPGDEPVFVGERSTSPWIEENPIPEMLNLNADTDGDLRSRPRLRIKRDREIPYKLISDEFQIDGPMNYQGLLTSVFSPFLFAALPSSDVACAKLSSFKKRFKITSDILKPIEELHAKGLKFILAGGKLVDFCNNKSFEDSTNDYDLWSSDEDNRDNLNDWINTLDASAGVVEKGHVIEFFYSNKKFQAIQAVYAGPEDIIQNFDIRLCSIATDGEYVYWIKDALRDVLEKRLVVMNVQANKGSVLRVQKYIQRGYNISGPDFALASLSCLMSFDNHRGDIINFFTQRDQTLMDVNESLGAASQAYFDMSQGFHN